MGRRQLEEKVPEVVRQLGELACGRVDGHPCAVCVCESMSCSHCVTGTVLQLAFSKGKQGEGKKRSDATLSNVSMILLACFYPMSIHLNVYLHWLCPPKRNTFKRKLRCPRMRTTPNLVAEPYSSPVSAFVIRQSRLAARRPSAEK